jgi:FLVCR family MFS transporter 7
MVEEFKEYRMRWVILLLFCLGNFGSSMLWVACAPITHELADVSSTKIYGVSDLLVQLCSVVFMIAFVPVVFPSNYVLDVFGLRSGVLAGSVLTFTGGMLRVGAFSSFYWILAGQTLAAIGQPFLINGPAKLAAFWFRPDMVRSI